MTVDALAVSAPQKKRNPYIGPRAFRADESLPNRQREARDLADLVIAERVVLLHSPSGAGKTSLIQAAVLDMLAADGFKPIRPARVDKPLPPGDDSQNRYLYSIALYLLGDAASDLREAQHLSLGEILDKAKPPLTDGEVPVLVFDQLEEILTLDPTDWSKKQEFFRQLGAVLADGSWWALLAMREDYMGGLNRYLRFFPGYLRSRYRLDFLSHDEALAAVRNPAKDQRVTFDEDAARALVAKLATTEVDQSGPASTQSGSASGWQAAPYVEPVVLQVVCHKLWKDVRAKRGEDFHTIVSADIENVDITRAIGNYYEDRLADVVSKGYVSERALRDWFETELITAQGFRRQTTTGPISGEQASEVLKELEDGYLIRADTRANTTWYELAHDRLIQVVRSNNYAWRNGKLEEWQVAAWEWSQNGRPREFLLRSKAALPLMKPGSLMDYEREFLAASDVEIKRIGGVMVLVSATTLLFLIAIAEAVVIVLFIFGVL